MCVIVINRLSKYTIAWQLALFATYINIYISGIPG